MLSRTSSPQTTGNSPDPRPAALLSTAPAAEVDVAIVGAGAAGLATAIFTARQMPGRRIAALDGATKLGAKILVAGGGRCNVTNASVQPADFHGTSRNTIRNVLAAFPVDRTVAFFREIGVELHEEEHGKLFPNTNRARTVLNALLAEADRLGVQMLTGARVHRLVRSDADDPLARASPGSTPVAPRFILETDRGVYRAHTAVLATGGRSLPKTGSDGGGYELARELGHALVPTTPALVPLTLTSRFHERLRGIAHEAELLIKVGNAKPLRLRGSLLWTHFGVSGPVVLDASRHWHRARLEGREVRVSASLLPGESFESADRWLMQASVARPREHLHNALASRLPARLAAAMAGEVGVDPQLPLAHLSKALRQRLAHALAEWPLPVTGSRGYGYAEVTAGGVPLSEIDPATMSSRCCDRLFLVGEILDVDGRIGGFNFQWSWSSAWVAARGITQLLRQAVLNR